MIMGRRGAEKGEKINRDSEWKGMTVKISY